MAINPNAGAFIGSTQIWEIPDPSSPQFKELIVKLHQNINSIAILLNLKDTGQYSPNEFVCGQQYALGDNPSQIFRKLINFGALPDTDTKTIAHGIAPTVDAKFTRIYGAASDTTNRLYLPLPYASSTAANNIELSVDATNVTIITGSNRSAYASTFIVLEYMLFQSS